MELKTINILDAANKVLFDDDTGFFKIQIRSVLVKFYKDDGNFAEWALNKMSTSESGAINNINDLGNGNYFDILRNFNWKNTLYYRENYYCYRAQAQVQKVTDYSLDIQIDVYKLYSDLKPKDRYNEGTLDLEVRNKAELMNICFNLVDEKEYRRVSPAISELCENKSFGYGSEKVTIVKVYDNPTQYICDVQKKNGERISVKYADIDQLFYLPYDDIPKSKFDILNNSKNELELLPYLSYSEGIYNLYWKKIDLASNYIVSVYKIISISTNKKELYHLEDVLIDRNKAYCAFDRLIGGNFAFKVIAENRQGERIAESRGMYSLDNQKISLSRPKMYDNE